MHFAILYIVKNLIRINLTLNKAVKLTDTRQFKVIKETPTRYKLMHKINGVPKFEFIKKDVVNQKYHPSILNQDIRYGYIDYYIWATPDKVKSIIKNF